MVKMALFGVLIWLSICSFIDASNVPVIAWSNTRNLYSTRQISAGEEIGRDSLKNDFLDPALGVDHQPQTIVLVVLEKLNLGDLTRYSDAYGSDSQGGVIPTIKTSMESAASSLVLPQTDTSNIMDDLMSKVTDGEVIEVTGLAELKSVAVDPTKTNLLIVRVEPSESMEEQLAAADSLVKAAMDRLEGKLRTPYTIFFTASSSSKDSSRASGRRLLQVDADDSANFTFVNFTEGGCEAYFFAAKAFAYLIYENEKTPNQTLELPKGGWSATGSECLSNRTLKFKIKIDNLLGVNGSDWIESVGISLTFNSTVQNFWYVEDSTIDFKLKDQEEMNHEVETPGKLETPFGWSYHCGDLTLTKKNRTSVVEMVYLTFRDFQIQPFEVSKDKFSSANDCIGYFTPAIWMGVITALLIIGIISFGLSLMATVKVMDKFDDPKGKQLQINVPES